MEQTSSKKNEHIVLSPEFKNLMSIIKKYHIYFSRFDDDPKYILSKTDIDKDKISEVIELLGETEMVSEDFEKDDRCCIETRVGLFKKYNMYVQEVSIGSCHYRDIIIEDLYEVNYYLVEPKEITVIDYQRVRKL